MPGESVTCTIGKLYQENSKFIDEIDEKIEDYEQICEQFTDLDDEEKQKMSYAEIKSSIIQIQKGIKTSKALQAFLMAKLKCIEESFTEIDEEIVDEIKDKFQEIAQVRDQFQKVKEQLQTLGVAALKKKYKKRYKKIKSDLSIRLFHSLFLWFLSGMLIAYFVCVVGFFLKDFDQCQQVYANIDFKNQNRKIRLFSFELHDEIQQCINIKLVLESCFKKLLPVIIVFFEIIYFLVVSMNKKYSRLSKTWRLYQNAGKGKEKKNRNELESFRVLIK